MSKVINHIEIETFVHATESLEKVNRCLGYFGLDMGQYKAEEMEGHYGNPILMLHAKVSKKRDIDSFLSSPFLFSTRSEICDTLEMRVDDEGLLYVRADKQDLCEDALILCDRGDIRISMKFLAYPQRRDTVIQNARKLLCDRPEGV